MAKSNQCYQFIIRAHINSHWPHMTSNEINNFQNPSFSCDIEKIPPILQTEMIDLQCNDALKIIKRKETLIDIHKFLPNIQYPNLTILAIEYIISIYICATA